MKLQNHMPVPLAVRVYPEPGSPGKTKPQKRLPRPESMLVFDTETTVDATQRLLFGSYRFISQGTCEEEGLFYADDLKPDQSKILRDYVESNGAYVDIGSVVRY
jgi:hypothetical protein